MPDHRQTARGRSRELRGAADANRWLQKKERHCFGPVIYNENTYHDVWCRKAPLERGHKGVTGTECLLRLCRVRLHVMTPRRRETFPPVTLGQIRGHGCRNLLVYCESLWCNHGAVMNADDLPDEMPVRSLCPPAAVVNVHSAALLADPLARNRYPRR
jgi:hypothetical protein